MLLSDKNLNKRSANEIISEFVALAPIKRYLYFWRKGFTTKDLLANMLDSIIEGGGDAAKGLINIAIFILLIIKYLLIVLFFPVVVTYKFFNINAKATEFVKDKSREATK